MRFGLLLIAAALPLGAETGSLTIHMILHAIGEERYEVAPVEGGLALTTTFEYSDRGNKRTTTATMRLGSGYTPLSLKTKERPNALEIRGRTATVQEDGSTRTFALPQRYAAVFGSSPFAVQMMMMRYWKAHGKPPDLPVLRANPAADPIRIELAGQIRLR